jgi:hypothetical protein
MKIELKKLKVAEHLSEETTAYSADVYVNGKCIGYAQNNGQGGETDIRCHFPADSSERKLCAEAEAWATEQPPYSEGGGQPLPMTLDFYLDLMVYDVLLAKAEAKEQAKLKRMQLKEIHVGVPDSGRYRRWSWKKMTLAELAAIPSGKGAVQSRIDILKRDMKADEVIINAEYLRALGFTV